MKNATLLAVKHAALLLIEANQLTTTLEVKNLLRHLGYYVDQSEVSAFMEEAVVELPLTFTTDNDPVPHKIFTLPSVASVASAQGPAISLADLADNIYHTRFHGDVYLFEDAIDLEANGLTVYRKSYGDGNEFYFAQDISRELARSAHAGVTQADYNDIGSSVY